MTNDKKIIAVVGASSGAGATFVAKRLAVFMAQKCEGVTYLENHNCSCPRCMRKPLVFYDMGLYKTFFPGRFADFFFMKFMGDDTDRKVNLYKNVNWVVRRMESPCCKLFPEDVAGKYIIWDNPEEQGSSHADLILCIVDVDIAHVMSGIDNIRSFLRDSSSKTKIVLNRVKSDALVKKTESYIGRSSDFVIWEKPASVDKNIKEIADYVASLY